MKIKPEKSKNATSLFRRSFVFFACFVLASITAIHAQTNTITGTVTDNNAEPLIGVTVRIQGTSTGTITDIDGNYSIAAKSNETLEFSFVGMKPQLIAVGSKTRIDVVLEDDATMLTETVVIGYGTAKKRDLTGSIASIRAEDIANRPSANPLASLQGKVAGVQVVNTGIAGQDPEIRIRGTNSINGYKPLYVVDGLFNDNISFLNSADIESMEILKDPSSLAIFGVRGANGVIIVTTKKAKEGQTLVNINTSFGFKSVVDKIKMANASQFKELYSEQLANQGASAFDYTNWNNDTNWQDEVFQTGFITNNNISITSSTEKNKFYMGVGYTSEEGNIKHEKYDKITINLSSDYNITKDLKVGFQFNGARATPLNTAQGLYTNGVKNALYAAPIASPYNAQEGLYNTLPSFQKNEVSNPMTYVELQKDMNKVVDYRASGNIYGDLNFFKHFNFRVMYSLDYRSYDSRLYTPKRTVWDVDTQQSVVMGDGKTAVEQQKQNETKVQADYLLTYTNSFNNHNITATAGFTTYYNSLSSLTAKRGEGNGLPIANDSDKWFVSIGDPDAATNASTQWERSTVSFLFRALYNYKNKYLFNGSFRRDGSSAFYYTGNEWQNFYSLGAGWVITEEDFMKDLTFLDYLKVKGSWGTLGNQNMDRVYPAEPILTNSTSAVFGDNIIPGYSKQYLPNSNLRWEKVEAWEAGLEAYFLRNRLNFEGVYYKKNTKDLLAEVPGITGTTPGLGNLGQIENKGVELSLSWNDRIGSDWRYGISANLTTIKNKVISLVQDGYTITDGTSGLPMMSYTQAGYPIGYFYGYKVEGIYQSESDIANSPANKLVTVKPGDLKFKDVNGDGEITTADRTQIGNPTPDFTYGVSFNAGYKNFDLSVDMMGVQGNEIYRTWNIYEWSQFNYLENRMNRWHGEGTSNSEPILDRKRSINGKDYPSEYFVEDGSFFRIRNIQLGYTFGSDMLKKLRMKSLRVYINAQNPKTWKNNTGYSPEIGGSATAFGIDANPYPVPAVYTFGLNLTF
ncbi:TonB-dependent receptor [Dysgonomonas sp. 521]|uniref:SusC/RagA family TonB-linked outer membrane protein n=1 Tax=Dysgonomonas sp. 521 TaxID=2302932 RepID=UPI0013D4FE85|nr:TonB-dependent receptor [Dysgonomonas sp. 521]NDV94028.1 TonB-dependent receptor [Dysgonomonas sp. 521]